MKTTINIRNMKKLTMTMCVTLIFAAAGFTQSSTEAYSNEVKASLDRLEKFMNSAEEALKYSAPAVYKENEAFAAAETSPEMERLDILAAATEESLKYKAPEVNEIPDIDYIDTNSTIVLLAHKTDMPLK